MLLHDHIRKLYFYTNFLAKVIQYFGTILEDPVIARCYFP